MTDETKAAVTASETPWTAGEWEIEEADRAILILEPREIGKGLVAEVIHFFRENERNLERAHLIAAAPKLYACVADAVSMYDGMTLDEVEEAFGPRDREFVTGARAALHRANPALSAGEKG
jgi:hypothetical protein